MPEDDRHSLTQLADLAGVTPRTVRYYLAQGLLPAVGQTGPGAKYDERHLARLRLVRRLQAEHLPLAEIRRRLDDLTDDEIRDLAGASEPEPPRESALQYLRGVLGGAALAKSRRGPDLRVHVPPPLRVQGLADDARPQGSSSRLTASESLLAGSRFEPVSVPEFTPATGDPATRPAYGTPPLLPPSFTPSTSEPAPMERSQWDRLALSPDIELHIRRPLARAQQKQVDRLVAIARELLEEERP
jgi:DNA-binding transcriptional MerR regulator